MSGAFTNTNSFERHPLAARIQCEIQPAMGVVDQHLLDSELSGTRDRAAVFAASVDDGKLAVRTKLHRPPHHAELQLQLCLLRHLAQTGVAT